ncbi:unnamed protein product [Paramecium sonneborni]|uniref:Transmembrane protein n=1 Tax=Paramecium sonneborni TaxID=65129 RepID=A0A8S1R8L3_9CILI|nr:unnamed protein product [Paramecium sonneborni]
MLLFLQFYIVSSMYPISYIDERPYLKLDYNLQVQLKLDEVLSEFLQRHSSNDRCPDFQQEECYEEIYQNGQKTKIKLEKEIFYLYDIQSEQQNSQTIVYSDQQLDQNDKDLISFLALAPFQNHQNTFYQNGFSLCLSQTDGYLSTNFNTLSLNILPEKTQGVYTRLKEELYTTYGLHIQNMEISFKVKDISSYAIYIVSEDVVSIPNEIFPHKYFLTKGFKLDTSGFYYRDHQDNDNVEDLDPLLFYNYENQDNPLIIDPVDYIVNVDNSQDLLKIYSDEQYNNAIILGLPFLKNKFLNVQTDENYVFVSQLNTSQCIVDQDQSIQVWEIIFIILQVILLPILVYLTFKKLRQHEQKKQQQQSQTQQFITELQRQDS